MAHEPPKQLDDGLILERGERAMIPPLKGISVPRPTAVHVIAQSHLDIIWYWPLSESVRMVLETFRGHADLLEADTSRTFCQSQVALFEIVREEEPALFARIARLVEEGRWEMVGGEWVEPALAIGGPEAHVRQLLLGQRYLQEHFGVKAAVGWCPDVFVMQPDCYPQLLAQAGIHRFVHKRPREKYMPLPVLPYRWRGNDGSEVVALRSTNKGDGLPALSDGFTADTEKGDVTVIAEHFLAADIPHLWGPLGVGDIGGVNEYVLPKVPAPMSARYSTPTAYFDAVLGATDPERLPLVEGVLGPIFTGCLTTWAVVKSLNREAENLLQQTEFLMAASHALKFPVASGELTDAWRRLLMIHFHDALAGVGTESTQREVELALRCVVEDVRIVRRRYARRIAESVASGTETGMPLVVFNPLGHCRSDIVEARLTISDEDRTLMPTGNRDAQHHLVDATFHTADEYFEAVDDEGRSTPVMVEHFGTMQRRAVARVRLLARDVPAFGYKTLNLRRRPRHEVAGHMDDDGLETDRLRVRFDPVRGGISQLEDLETGMAIVAPDVPLGALRLHDSGNYDLNYGQEHNAWEAGLTGRIHVPDLHDFRLRRGNGDRIVATFDSSFGESHFRQTFLFEPGVPFVTVRFTGQFHEMERFLKAHFALEGADRGVADMPYGWTDPLPEGVEYAMQYVAAACGTHHALAVVNRGRHGCLWRDGTLSISLIRCANFPAHRSDRGPFSIEIRLQVIDMTTSNWQTDLVRLGYEANLALCSYAPEYRNAKHPRTWQLLEGEIDQVLGAAAKPCEDGEGIALRLYNPATAPQSQSFSTPNTCRRVVASNILEEPSGPVFDGDTALSFRPHEIKTMVCR